MTGMLGREAIVIIAVGNPDRGDDGVGAAVLEAVKAAGLAGARLVARSGEATELLAAMEGSPAAILVDACASGAPPGTVRRLEAGRDAIPSEPAQSTHALGLAEAIELGGVLGLLPPRLIVYAVEAASFAPGLPLSPEVAAIVPEVAARVRDEAMILVGMGMERRHA